MNTTVASDAADAIELPVASVRPLPVRVDLYSFVHRGLRAAIAQALVDVGRAAPEFEDAERVAKQVEDLVYLCRTHLEHENDFIHTAMNRRVPGSAKRTEGDHLEHEHAMTRLAELVSRLRSAVTVAELRETLGSLYRSLSLFLAHNLEHMDIEEQSNMRVLWSAYTDAELESLEHELVQSLDPETMLAFLRWMVPNVSAPERLAFFEKMQLGAPPEVVVGTLTALSEYLPGGEVERLLGHLAIRMSQEEALVRA